MATLKRKHVRRIAWIETQGGKMQSVHLCQPIKKIMKNAALYTKGCRVIITKQSLQNEIAAILRITGQDFILFPQLLNIFLSRKCYALISEDVQQTIKEGHVPDQRDRCPICPQEVEWFPIPRTKSS